MDSLSADLAVSVVTIRRDLDMLEQQGMLSRNHGGAVSIDPLFYEPFKNDRSLIRTDRPVGFGLMALSLVLAALCLGLNWVWR